ncbi:MAG: hypothetical protein Q8Q59_12490 [Luteolibacter sp.]|nr:hypothetical protein [Luteolibacter sp.]
MRAISLWWLVIAVSALGAPGDPGESALRFLEKVRNRDLNLEPGADTTLSPQTSGEKRREIARRLQRMASDLGSDPLEVGAVKLDGELAGVLVRKAGGFDPSRLQVFPIALVRRGDAWTATPVPASFENSGFGYAAAIRQRLVALQDWMLREQVLDLAHLRDQSNERMRRKIESSLPADTLRSLSSKQAAERFVNACARRSLPEILGLLGGLSSTPPDDWTLRLKAADGAIHAAVLKRPWRLLVSADVLRALVHHEEDGDSARISIACLDPSGNSPRSSQPRIELVHLELEKSADGFWRIDPPQNFIQQSEETETPGDELLDIDLLDAFPSKLAELYPPAPEPGAGQAMRALMDNLQSGGFSSLVPLTRFSGNAGKDREQCVQAARLWWAMHEPGALRRAILLEMKEDGGKAAAICQFFSARSPDRLDLRIFHFEKSTTGWFWTTQVRGNSDDFLQNWTRDASGRWQDGWRDTLLAECLELETLPESGAPREEQARALVDSWLEATRSGDVEAALRLTARLKTPDSRTVVLRNLGYEMTGSQRSRQKPIITSVHRSAIWTLVGVRDTPDGKPVFPLYPIIDTAAGPRILIEIDLFAASNRSRDFLNKTALARLRHLPPAATTELNQLFLKHQTGIETVPSP